MIKVKSTAPAVALVLTVWTVGCGAPHTDLGPVEKIPVHIEKASVERANLELNMGAGEMVVDSGGSDLISGELAYQGDDRKPILQNSEAGSHAAITLRQPSHSFHGGNNKEVWTLHLNPEVLWDMNVNCGAGHAKVDIPDLPLRSLAVHIGVGQVEVDLSGTPKRDYEVDISGGIGQATVQLPKDVGIYAEAHGGIGSIDITGLQKQGDHYQNALYDKSKVTVHVKVNGGIGEIKLAG